MPNRDDTRGFGGPGQGGDPARRGPSAPARGGGEARAFDDPRFQADDNHLTAELKRYGRERPARQPEYGHDGNFRPGYHEGGARFGFFHVPDDTGRPQTDQEFDPDYVSWREQQMHRHDHDYAEWRREQRRKYDDDYWKFRSERRDDFHQRFQDWRAQREAAAAAEAANPDDKL